MISPQEFAEEMKNIVDTDRGDWETAHILADSLMLETLEELGYEDGCKIFDKMPKWYA